MCAGFKKTDLPCIYRWNKKSWMTAKLFSEWLQIVNNKMRIRGRKILMFLDNCGAHPKLELSNIELKFLPPNTTSKLQPLDAGIIMNVKSLYRKRLVRHVLGEMDESDSAAPELAKSVTLLHAIKWLDLAWNAVKAISIERCFHKCGFGTGVEGDAEEPLIAANEEQEMRPVMGCVLGGLCPDGQC